LSYENTYSITLNNSRNEKHFKNFKFQSLDKTNNDKSFINNKYRKNNNKKKLTNSLSKLNPNLKQKINNAKQKKNKSNDIFNDLEELSYCDKHKYKVSEYCRTCKKFFCPQCRLNQVHDKHLTIKLNLNNLEESIKLYIMLIITNEQRNIDIIKKNAFSNGDIIIDEELLYKRKDSVAQQCDKMIDKYNLFMKKIEKK
jgi:hypothetical protein